ncbi:MAG: hypothetical protein COV38_15285 [Bdellovibrionales bacterium CG11_big_fil_rev_8_21_14_0_20_38_13]|nr:MAG: hypothetical protein COV38_15285 [Bdellovibrionales bacterium CG11_big_fil_rev_8_21_14_0_20_38_13]
MITLAFSPIHPECEECARESNEQLNVLTDASTLAQANCEVNPYLDEPDNQAMYKNLVRAQKTHEICSTDRAQKNT